MTAFLVGKAQEEGFLNINNKSNQYLGNGWSKLTQIQENKITVKHQLTMTTGLDDGVADSHCTDPACLTYLAEPGTRWAYHNGPYTLLDGVIEGATGQGFDNYFNAKLKNKIGMDGFWTYIDYDHVYFSTPRAMARYGLLILNKGKWQDEEILGDAVYFQEMVNTSQNINPSYGYLWWLNGKSSFKVPGLQTSFSFFIAPNAPSDMFAAMGKNGQFINIVPSQNLVMIRMGDNPDNSEVPVTFQNDLWAKIKEVVN